MNKSVKRCKICGYVDRSASATTSAMASHLLKKHNITKPDAQEQQDLNSVSDASSSAGSGSLKRQSILSLGVRRTAEEWLTRLVVEYGLSLRQISKSEFHSLAFSSMKLKHYKSHVSVGKVVTEFIHGMIDDTKKELASRFRAGKRFSVIADEWTSIRNRRFLSAYFYIIFHFFTA